MSRSLFTLAAVILVACGTEPSSPTVHLKPCVVSGTPWLAYRAAPDGPWTQVTPDAAGGFNFSVPPRVSVAWSFQGAESRRETWIVNATADELAAVGEIPCGKARGTATLKGTVAGASQSAVVISAANRAAVVGINGATDWSLSEMPVTPVDLVASLVQQPVYQFIIRRGITAGAQSLPVSQPSLDFTSAEARSAQVNTISVSGALAGGLFANPVLTTEGGTIHPLYFDVVGTTSVSLKSLPAELRRPTDVHSVALTTRNGNGSDFRFIFFGFNAPTDRTVAFGPAMSAAAFASITLPPYPRMRATAPSVTEYPDAARVAFLESFRAVYVTTTAAYLGATPGTWEFEVPDLTAAGYQKEWGNADVPRIFEIAATKGSLRVLLGGAIGDGELALIGLRRTIQ